MKTYILMVRILGGEWQRYKIGGKDYETSDMVAAMGMKDTIADPIREVMIVSIDTAVNHDYDSRTITKKYELVE